MLPILRGAAAGELPSGALWRPRWVHEEDWGLLGTPNAPPGASAAAAARIAAAYASAASPCAAPPPAEPPGNSDYGYGFAQNAPLVSPSAGDLPPPVVPPFGGYRDRHLPEVSGGIPRVRGSDGLEPSFEFMTGGRSALAPLPH